ncbi:hypothetical protein PENTCL1PPCAC_7108 [Pristionchus entomophagus]|uniref:Uncharacterized protein n=1 Tax=Pristionchus entomophagus TaxID=358040 RepID=A0AAV5SP71_9BILA|nr:hypothetical protein PENTCL1PPCAC_7108 [Pristionchus entomophagus]
MNYSMKVDEDEFIIWDEEVFINNTYESLGYRIHPDLFKIHSQFVMDSAFEKHRLRQKEENFDSDVEDSYKGSDEAKRVHLKLFDRSLEDVNTRLSSIARKAKKEGRKSGKYREGIPGDNNLSARSKSKSAMDAVMEMRLPGSATVSSSMPIDNLSLSTLSMMSPWFECGQEKGRVVGMGDDTVTRNYLIPVGSSFHVGDATQINEYGNLNDIIFDFIVMDPPWMNLSVKRKKTYSMNDDILGAINIPSILEPEGVLAMWVTNSVRVHNMVEKQLKVWGLARIGVWYWLKTTTSGRPTTSLVASSSGKQPYEAVIFCVRKERRQILEEEKKLPQRNLVFASTPMCIHSRKPSIMEIYRKMVPDAVMNNPLEIFARSLYSGCTSIGYEPLLLQNIEFFEKL